MPKHFCIGAALSTAPAPSLIPPGLRSVHTAGPGGHSAFSQHPAQKSFQLAPNVDLVGATLLVYGKPGPQPAPSFPAMSSVYAPAPFRRQPATRPWPTLYAHLCSGGCARSGALAPLREAQPPGTAPSPAPPPTKSSRVIAQLCSRRRAPVGCLYRLAPNGAPPGLSLPCTMLWLALCVPVSSWTLSLVFQRDKSSKLVAGL